MKSYHLGWILWLLVTSLSVRAEASDRKTLFDEGWRFYLGSAKGAESVAYPDASWRTVDLPHDWSVEPLENQEADKVVGPFSRQSAGGIATGQTVGGEGWYRKTFVIAPEDAGKRHELYFEGIYNQSEVWINGRKAYRNVYGYSSFRFDITPYCNPAGVENVVAVRVLNEGKNSRWYSGSGIYRHVWLLRTSPSYIEDWGTFVRTASATEQSAEIALTTSVVNGDERGTTAYRLQAELLSAKGKVVAGEERRVQIARGDTLRTDWTWQVSRPELWSVDNPYLYTLRIRLWIGKEKADEYSVPFGIRTLGFSVERGFELNGNPMKLHGGCIHHDNGLLGAKAFDRAEERKVELLKANGFNAVRTSHNPMSESFLAACDRLGMLVVDEAFDQWERPKNPQDYHLYFKEWSAKDIRALVVRDRNHPSVILWSIGNEIGERAYDSGLAIAGRLKKEVLKYDDTRPVTAGINKLWDKKRENMLPLEKAYRPLDVVGHNYMWRFYEELHEQYPDQVMFGSESVATEAAQNWDKVEKHPYLIGDFIWTAMDYLGESGLGNSIEVDPQENEHKFMDWPWFNAWCGDLDLLGIKKPQSYYRDVLWRKREISLAVELPAAKGKVRKVSFWGWPEEALSWTFPGWEDQTLKVNVYTRASGVRLYLNGVPVGEGKTNDLYTASFQVPYRPGKLKAVELDEAGREGASALLETVGEPVSLRLVADRRKLAADGQDLSYILIEQVDRDGNVVQTSGQKVSITAQGDAGTLIASGTASPNDMRSFQSLTPALFRGRAMLIVRSGKKKGKLTLRVTADGLKEAVINMKSN